MSVKKNQFGIVNFLFFLNPVLQPFIPSTRNLYSLNKWSILFVRKISDSGNFSDDSNDYQTD